MNKHFSIKSRNVPLLVGALLVVGTAWVLVLTNQVGSFDTFAKENHAIRKLKSKSEICVWYIGCSRKARKMSRPTPTSISYRVRPNPRPTNNKNCKIYIAGKCWYR